MTNKTAAIEEWQPIKTAPRNGKPVVLTWMEDGVPMEQWVMWWDPKATNGLFPGVVGMWTSLGRTWNEADPAGAPTHWKPWNPTQ